VGTEVRVSKYVLRGVPYYLIRPAAEEAVPVEHDMERLPRFLFIGAAVVTLITLLTLWWQMPDLVDRMRWLVRALARERLRVYGTHHVPTDGPTILVTNCRSSGECMQVLTSIDRTVRFITPPLPAAKEGEAAATIGAVNDAMRYLDDGFLVGLTAAAEGLLPQLQARVSATVLPVYYGRGENGSAIGNALRVSFGEPLPPHATLEEARKAIREAAGALDDT
jgi:hypothetical protein